MCTLKIAEYCVGALPELGKMKHLLAGKQAKNLRSLWNISPFFNITGKSYKKIFPSQFVCGNPLANVTKYFADPCHL
jgi:hypothetical protein